MFPAVQEKIEAYSSLEEKHNDLLQSTRKKDQRLDALESSLERIESTHEEEKTALERRWSKRLADAQKEGVESDVEAQVGCMIIYHHFRTAKEELESRLSSEQAQREKERAAQVRRVAFHPCSLHV